MHKVLSVKSRVRGDFHARFCERVRVKLPRSTRPMNLPARFMGIVQSLRYVLITWLTVDNRFYLFVAPCRIHVHPFVFFRIVGNRIFLVAHALSVSAIMPT